MLKNKNISKVLNYKSISSLSLIGMGLIFTQKPTEAMFRNALTSASRTLQSISSSLSTNLKKTPTNQTVKYFYSSNGKRAIFTPSPTTSTTTTPSNNQNQKTRYFYGSNGKIPLQDRTILSSNIHTSNSASASTSENLNKKTISNLAGEINRFTAGIKSISDDYAALSRQIRAHIERIQNKSKK